MMEKTGEQQIFSDTASKEKKVLLWLKVCVFATAFLVFANAIPNQFNIDDIYYTTPNNPVAARGIKAIPQIFTTHTLRDESDNSFDYRPIPMLTFALQHQFISGAPIVSHFINVVLYAMVCLLVFVLLFRWLGYERVWLAFLAAMLYVVHPLHTEVVDNIKSRDELLCTLFAVLAMLSAWRWQQTTQAKHMVVCVLFFIAGMLCKMTVVLYLPMVLLSFYFFSDMPLKKMLVAFGIMIAGVIVALVIVRMNLPETKRVFRFFENPLYTDKGVPRSVKTATASFVLGRYLLLHLVPYPLSFYYGYRYVQLFYWSILPILSALAYITLVWLAIKNIRNKGVISFGIIWFLVCIVPFSNLLRPSPGMMAERFTFAASLGYCIFFAALLGSLFKIKVLADLRTKRAKYLAGVCLVFFLSYAGISVARNEQWEDCWTLFSHDIKHLQSSARVNAFYAGQVTEKLNRLRYMVGVTAGAEQQKYLDSVMLLQEEEKDAYVRAAEIAPNYYEAILNAGVAYINLDSTEQARVYLYKAWELSKGNADVHNSLAQLYAKMSRKNDVFRDSAITHYKKTLEYNPKLIPAYSGLALLYLNNKDTGSAVSLSLEGIKRVPDESVLYMQLGQIYMYKKDTVRAIQYEEQGANVPHPDPILLQMLQGYYGSKGDTVKERYYRNKAEH